MSFDACDKLYQEFSQYEVEGGLVNIPLFLQETISQEQIDILNYNQKLGKYHPLTCCSDKDCLRTINEGILISTEKEWAYPCRGYTQQYSNLDLKTKKNEL